MNRWDMNASVRKKQVNHKGYSAGSTVQSPIANNKKMELTAKAVITTVLVLTTLLLIEFAFAVPLMPKASAVGPYILSFDAFDYDNKGEVTILVNDEIVVSLPLLKSPQQDNQQEWIFGIDLTDFLVEGTNNLTFEQKKGSSFQGDLAIWHVYGNDDQKCLWKPDRTSWTYNFYFSENGTNYYYIEYQNYDFKTIDEVTITLNGQVVDVQPGCSQPYRNGWIYANLRVPFVVTGTNNLTFTENTDTAKIRNLVVGRDNQVLFNDTTERSITKVGNASTTYTFTVP